MRPFRPISVPHMRWRWCRTSIWRPVELSLKRGAYDRADEKTHIWLLTRLPSSRHQNEICKNRWPWFIVHVYAGFFLRRVQQSTNVDMVPTLEDDLGLVRKHSFVDLWFIITWRRLSLESDSRICQEYLLTSWLVSTMMLMRACSSVHYLHSVQPWCN